LSNISKSLNSAFPSGPSFFFVSLGIAAFTQEWKIERKPN
jgi:hypothetical protein